MDEETVERLIESWCRRGVPRNPEHLYLEIANAIYRGHGPGEPPPLEPGDPVPGCACSLCTGVETPEISPTSDTDDGLPVEEARQVPILEIVARLGCGPTERRGQEVRATCPLHDDENPSLTISPEQGLWYCFPCAEGGDGIRLVERALSCSFPDAVHWITGGPRYHAPGRG